VSAFTDRRHLRSVQSGLLRVLRTSTNYGDCSFAVQSTDFVRGTVFLQNCIRGTCWSRSDINCRLFCSFSNCWLSTFVALRDLALYTNSLIKLTDQFWPRVAHHFSHWGRTSLMLLCRSRTGVTEVYGELNNADLDSIDWMKISNVDVSCYMVYM